MDHRLTGTRPTPRRGAIRTGLPVVAALLLHALPAHADRGQLDIADLSIEELANIQITSVSKKPERLADAAASVFVITADEIRRSGANSLPEVLRLAPNLHVARTSGHFTAMSARGLSGTAGSQPNKLLVLVDGRSVYTPLFGGVFWDTQELMLEDVERIEVISGPAGTLWGLNAFSGVINITTRSARDTHGSVLAARYGQAGRDAVARYGAATGKGGSYRVYAKYFDRDHTELAGGGPVDDSWHRSQVGFRADWAGADSQFMVQGNAYDGTERQPRPGQVITGAPVVLGTIPQSGVNLTTRWTRALGAGASVSAQAYYDRAKRVIRPFFGHTDDIVDVQLQHSLGPLGRHSVVWGVNYRYSHERVTNSDYFAFLPAHVDQKWSSLFGQDEVTLGDALRLTVGARLERNPYTGLEFLPSARLAWKLGPAHHLWTAASRAVRSPARLDRDVYVPGRPPFQLDNAASMARSEVARVYELGYRGQPLRDLSYSVSVFHNGYDHMRSQEIGPTRRFALFDSKLEGRANGIEMWGAYQLAPGWRLNAGYTALHERFSLKPGSTNTQALSNRGRDPSYTAQLRVAFAFAPRWEFDVGVRRVAELPQPGLQVPAYTAFDARLGWRVRPRMELSLAAQELGPRHAEYGGPATRTVFEPALALKLVMQL